MRAGGDLEGTHLGRRVHRREIEGERIEAALAKQVLRGGEVAMPRLVEGARKRDVEPDLDDLIVGSERRAADADEPRVRDQIDESPERLRMDLHVEPVRPPTDGA